MKKKVLVRGPAQTRSGYGEHARLVLRSLREYEEFFDIYFDSINWGQTSFITAEDEFGEWLTSLRIKTESHVKSGGTFDVSVQVTIPNEFKRVATRNIGVTAGIETTKISPEWIQKTSEIDKIIVPSEHAKWSFDNTSYPAKNNQTGEIVQFKNNKEVKVIGYPTKPPAKTPIDLELENDFNFLAIAQWGPRKNMDNMIEWFLEEFSSEEVGLVLKVSLRRNCLKDRRACTRKLQTILKKYPDRKCKVHLLHGNMTDEEISSLYIHPKIKALITSTHGEGYGLPIFEAAYNDLPVLAPAWSGHVDFLYAPKKDKKGKIKQKAHFTKVGYDMGVVQQEAVWPGVIHPDSQWCYPKKVSFRDGLRALYKNYNLKKSDAKKLGKHVREKFSEKSIYKSFASEIYGQELVKFDPSTLPKISILTSVYDGDEFIEQFLKDMTRQTAFDKCELILVNANSPGNEKEIISKYVEKYPDNIKYYELEEDPGIYGTWNFALSKATGEFVTNANLDDRKAINSLEEHAKQLVLNPDVSLVYADSYITNFPNETFEENMSHGQKYNFEQFSKEAMLRGNQPHNNPMWRKSLHDKYGEFDSEYRSAGDWEFWLRCAAEGEQFKKIDGILGLYYFNPKGISTNYENFSWKQEEESKIYEKYKKKISGDE